MHRSKRSKPRWVLVLVSFDTGRLRDMCCFHPIVTPLGAKMYCKDHQNEESESESCASTRSRVVTLPSSFL